MILDLVRPRKGATTYLEPDSWLRQALTGGAGPTLSGETVNPTTADNYSAVYAAKRAIYEPVSSVPLPVYRRLDGGGKERVRDDPRHYALNVRANEYMTGMQLREFLLNMALGWGNGFAESKTDGFPGSAIEIRPIHPLHVRMEDRNGDARYVVEEPGEPKRYVLPEAMIHIRGPSSNGVWGDSIITRARESIGLGLTAEKHGSAFFANGARTSGAFVLPQKPAKAGLDQLRNDLEATYAGAKNSGKFMLLFGGMDYKTFSMPHDDAQFLETRKFQITEIARWFNVPPHMIGDYDQMKWANIEQAALAFVQYTLRAWMVRIEQELNAKLFGVTEGLFVEHLIDGLLRGDAATRAAALQIQRRNGIINANEWREIENMNPLPGDQGEKYIIEGNMTTLEKAGEEPAPAPSTANDAPDNGVPDDGGEDEPDANRFEVMNAAFSAMFEDVVCRCLRRESNETTKAARKFEKSRDSEWLSTWAAEFYETHWAYCKSALAPVVAAYNRACGLSANEDGVCKSLMDVVCVGEAGAFTEAVTDGNFGLFIDRVTAAVSVPDKIRALEAACRK